MHYHVGYSLAYKTDFLRNGYILNARFAQQLRLRLKLAVDTLNITLNLYKRQIK